MQRIILPHIALFFANTIYAINYLFAARKKKKLFQHIKTK